MNSTFGVYEFTTFSTDFFIETHPKLSSVCPSFTQYPEHIPYTRAPTIDTFPLHDQDVYLSSRPTLESLTIPLKVRRHESYGLLPPVGDNYISGRLSFQKGKKHPSRSKEPI